MSRDASSPAPSVRVAFRVGITGHRSLEGADPDAIRSVLGQILQRIQQTVAALPTPEGCDGSQRPLLKLISPLAAGTDQIAAELALELGFELHCPLPFPEDLYRADFDDDDAARERFDALRAAASSVMVLHDRRDEASRGDVYLAAGRVVVNQSDLLLAVWDGEPAAGPGGTGQIVEEALRAGVPVVRVPLYDPEAFALLGPPPEDGGTSALGAIDAQVGHLLLPYAAEKLRPAVADQLEAYARFSAEAPPKPAPAPGAVEPEGNATDVDAQHRWADTLAGTYAKLYQRSFVGNYILGALAVTLGLLAYIFHVGGYPHATVLLFAIGEFAAVLAILAVYRLGRKRKWRLRAVQYRTLAEQLRTLDALEPIALAVPHSRPPAHQGEDADLRSTWTSWHVRAITRTLPLPAVTCDDDYRESQRARLLEWAGGQEAYYEASSARANRVHHRVERLALAAFVLAATAVFADIVLAVLQIPNLAHGVGISVVLLGVALPAWGSAAHAILAQLESRRLATRYLAMAGRLRSRMREIESAGTHTPHAGIWTLWHPAHATARDLVGEVADWQLLQSHHAIPLP